MRVELAAITAITAHLPGSKNEGEASGSSGKIA
jgi:hypothetical protein